eukprot:m.105887 g.105887  ORF g.105887 m.105887 type:complete len:412 (-) comp9161_c0_seq1:58-1293(-)
MCGLCLALLAVLIGSSCSAPATSFAGLTAAMLDECGIDAPSPAPHSLPSPPPGTAYLSMYRIGSAKYSADLKSVNLADIDGEIGFVTQELCPEGPSSNCPQSTDVVGNYTVQVNSTFGCYYACNGGSCPSSLSCEPDDIENDPNLVGRGAAIFGNAGYWYSLPGQVQCLPDEPIGARGCAWKLARIEKLVNATCLKFNTSTELLDTLHSCPNAAPRCEAGCLALGSEVMQASWLSNSTWTAFHAADPVNAAAWLNLMFRPCFGVDGRYLSDLLASALQQVYAKCMDSQSSFNRAIAQTANCSRALEALSTAQELDDLATPILRLVDAVGPDSLTDQFDFEVDYYAGALLNLKRIQAAQPAPQPLTPSGGDSSSSSFPGYGASLILVGILAVCVFIAQTVKARNAGKNSLCS